MKLTVDEEFKKICIEILEENLDKDNWAEIESDDMFQSENYIAGFDSTEFEFCFSYYNENKEEFWFQFPLSNVQGILDGAIETIEMRPAER